MASSAYGQVDYKLCQNQFNNMKVPDSGCAYGSTASSDIEKCGYDIGSPKKIGEEKVKSSYYPFELLADGTIKSHPNFNYNSVGGVETLTPKGEKNNYSVVITRNEKGEIIGVKSIYKTNIPEGGISGMMGMGMYVPMNAGKNKKAKTFSLTNEMNNKVEIRNGKCASTRVDSTSSLGEESRQDVVFDARLCRNVNNFFKKNPEAASCFDKKLMSKANEVFDDFYKDNQDIYGDYDPEESRLGVRPRALKTKMLESQGMMPMNMGMMGNPYGMRSSSQMLQPYMPTIDSHLGASTYMGMSGYGSSPVITALQIKSLCDGGGFPGVDSGNNQVVNDESFWATEKSAAVSSDAKGAVSK